MKQQGYSDEAIKKAAEAGGDLDGKARKLMLSDLGKVWMVAHYRGDEVWNVCDGRASSTAGHAS